MSMNTSVRSTALEPGPGASWHRKLTSNYGMVILTVVLFAIFAIAEPDTFASLTNFQLLASSKSVLLILALAVTIPMIAGKIDLSIGYSVGLWQVMSLSWQLGGLDYRIVIVLVIVGGGVIGLLNALLVELAQVDAFIATLATGQVIYSITYWYTGGRQVTDDLGARAIAFDDLSRWSLGPIPGPFVIALAIGVVMWLVLEYLPVGRYLYAVGANPAAARLVGIPRRRYVVGAMVASGMLTALAGILLASRQAGVAQANIGPEYLLPALAAAFLGSTTIRPGRVNALGTVLGVAIATIGISGLQQLLPGRFFLEPLFNGLTLVAAITIASIASRRRVARADATPAAAPDTSAPATPSHPVSVGTAAERTTEKDS
ncbi:ABC transporter permease [Rathayibacter tanaceti]|uniref:Ribose transport system permease protein n=3 Tax=Rathayibacter tanaceti TaxID=1671680 RepID=A0ACD2XI53_9MICO|nr:ABC transporter permease [Rathayibacter tanaceti]KZX20065.1 Autoinducer 2 import system permease protein LsrD [Rathayibacter tanaceti]TCO36235.1 ribose transport system permease protein [Rathayibacter tanaceti]